MKKVGIDLPKLSLEGKVAVITGAASGIGLATSKMIAQAKAGVALLDIDSAQGQSAAEEIKMKGGKAQFYTCDVTSSTQNKMVISRIIQDYGRIDILFNNAGLIIRKDIVKLEEDEWERVLDVNLKSIYLLSRLVIPLMIKQGGGNIINTGSGWGLKGGPEAVSYCAAKGGVINLTRAMAIDCGKHNIRVNCICPGDVDTPLLRGEAQQLGQKDNEFMKEAADRPLGRVGSPLDIAHAVLFLASDHSSWTTGSIFVVDGGGLA